MVILINVPDSCFLSHYYTVQFSIQFLFQFVLNVTSLPLKHLFNSIFWLSMHLESFLNVLKIFPYWKLSANHRAAKQTGRHTGQQKNMAAREQLIADYLCLGCVTSFQYWKSELNSVIAHARRFKTFLSWKWIETKIEWKIKPGNSGLN